MLFYLATLGCVLNLGSILLLGHNHINFFGVIIGFIVMIFAYEDKK